MYNGIGLQTARGSGTNGYVQTNKFFVRPRNGGKPVSGGKGFEDDQGTAGISKKPNKDILEHDRKRQIHLKLVILEDKLADQGYSDAEIAKKLEEARVNLEAASASDESNARGESKISDTQTHQIAARKEKQMEAFRSALGLPDQQQAEEGIIDGEPTEEAYEAGVGRLKERREHSFLDRDSRRKLNEDAEEKDGKAKEAKKQRGDDDLDEVKRHKKNDSKKRRHDDSSDESEEHGRDRRRRSKKKAKGCKPRQETDSESDSSSSDSDSESDSDIGEKRRRKATKKRSRSKRSLSSESEEVESDDSTEFGRSRKKKRSSNRSGSKEVRGKQDEQRRAGRKRHDSDVSESESEDNKQQLHKKKEAYRGGQKQKREEEDVELDHLKEKYRGDSSGKKAARDSDESEPEYEKKKQLRSVVEAYSGGMKQRRDEEETLSKHGRDKYRSDSRGKKVASDSDDSETENENRRQLKDEIYQRGRPEKGDKDEDYNNHVRDRYRGGDDGGYNKHKMDDRYRGRAIEEEDNNDKRDDDDDDDEYKHDKDRYRQRRETAKEGDEDYNKHGRNRYRGDREDRSRGDVRRASYKEDKDGERNSREREYSNKGRAHYDGRTSGKRSSYADRD